MSAPILPKRLVPVSAVITLLLGLATFSITAWSTSGFLVWSDGVAYFLYARSAVLDLDIDVTNEFKTLERRHPADSAMMIPLRDWAKHDPNTGKVTLPWPAGAGLVMVPFYALGYAVERLAAFASARPPDSYGIIPQYFFALGSLAYGLLGFWATFQCCRQISSEKSAYLSSLAIVFAGPLAFYIFFNPTMAHASSFGLVSLLLLLWWRQWHQGTTPYQIAVLGLILGIAITIRYQNVLFGFLLAALVLRSIRSLSPAVTLCNTLAGIAGVLIPVALVILLPLYFAESPDLASHSGGAVGEGSQEVLVGRYPFNLASPYFFDVLFSCRHGAFYWAPILGVSFVGLIWAARSQSWAWILLITFLLHVYLIGALGIIGSEQLHGEQTTDWNNHWSGAPSFGMRYLTECGPLLAIGLAVLIQSSARRLTTAWWSIVLVMLGVWNGLLIMAYGLGTISRSYCITYGDMASGVAQVFATLLAKPF